MAGATRRTSRFDEELILDGSAKKRDITMAMMNWDRPLDFEYLQAKPEASSAGRIALRIER